ncbi:MAG: rhodanese-like domain-containing protein [Desulfuromonadales bacterium]|uniref:rhodanese-like domain-containing protein n=1 Tax=Desulfuromonas sp. KJ2020 TaxID=2919173 RepID=UPI0020A799E3|nr:rhodanese-like domain-containing protein [Desulfuromonas sp. KJ2020]MCP3176028.1 rhodanese-like domain-containing protein [Desulfuromonas sp. KJ2020]
MFKRLTLTFALILLLSSAALAANMMEEDAVKNLLEQDNALILVDIQPAEAFAKAHIRGSLETNAFPAKTAEEKARLDQVLPVIQSSDLPVVIVCPRGKSGARNSYDYLLSKGVPEDRLYILEGGMADWPFDELLVEGR